MTQIDWATLVNWVVAGCIGAVFGALGAWITYRFERRRDDIAWKREKERQLESFAQERELLDDRFQQRLQEIDAQSRREDAARARAELLRGIENPREACLVLREAISEFSGRRSMRLFDRQSEEMRVLLEIEGRLSQVLSDPAPPAMQEN